MFYRCTHADGRVVLTNEIVGHSASPVPGETWKEARERIDLHALEHVPGHGWYWEGSF